VSGAPIIDSSAAPFRNIIGSSPVSSMLAPDENPLDSAERIPRIRIPRLVMQPPHFTRLSLALAVFVLLLVVTSPLTTVWLIKNQANRIVEADLRALTTSSIASLNVSEGFLKTAAAVRENGSDLSGVLARIAESTANVDEQYETHRKTLQSAEDRKVFEHLLKCRKEYRETRERIFKLLSEGEMDEARALFSNECEPRYAIYVGALGDVVQANVTKARDSGRKILNLCNWLLGIQLVLLGFFFIYGFFVPLTALMERVSRKPVVFDE
jgi:hypothetical protein